MLPSVFDDAVPPVNQFHATYVVPEVLTLSVLEVPATIVKPSLAWLPIPPAEEVVELPSALVLLVCKNKLSPLTLSYI